MRGIKFPQVHIAESVVSRIMDIAEGVERRAAAREVQAAGPGIETAVQGAVIDAQLMQPVLPMPGIDEVPAPGATAAGKPALATLLEPQQ